MAQPPSYTRQYDFTSFQTVSPADPLPASGLESELNALKTTLDAVLVNLALIQRDDGELANALIEPFSLSTTTLGLLASGSWVPKGDWATSTAYVVGDLVEESSIAYICVEDHTSGTFATDLAAVKWMAISSASSAAGISFSATGNIVATDVQAAIEELDVEKQPLDAALTSLSGLNSAANKLAYYTASDTLALTDLTSFGRSLIDDANAAAARTTLGVAAAVDGFEDVASAGTTDIGAASSRNVRITGTTTITGLGTADAGTFRRVRFAAALTLTHNGTSLILPGTANITTAADDTATFVSLGSGNWLCLSYKRATGLPVAFVDEDDMSSDSAVLAPSQQSVKAYVDRTRAAGGSLDLSSGTGGTISNLGGVTDPDFIEIDLTDISADGTDNLEITIGDSGGLEPSGYDAGSAPAGVGTGGVITSTSAFVLQMAGAARVTHARIVMTHLGSNKWLFQAYGGRTTSADAGVLGWGTKTLSGTLTQVAVGLSGTDDFDGTGGAAKLRAGKWA